MFPVLHAMLAAILGSGASAAPAPQVPSGGKLSTLPVITYGASALGQPAGGVEEVSNRNLKLKGQLKANKATKNWEWKQQTNRYGKVVKVKHYLKGTEYKDNINR